MEKKQKVEMEDSTVCTITPRMEAKMERNARTKAEGRGRRGFLLDYQDVKSIITAGKRTLKIDDNRQIDLRKYHLTRQELNQLLKESGDSFPNPYSRGGAYYAAVQALSDLGANEWQDPDEIFIRMESLMSEASGVRNMTHWEVFCGRGTTPIMKKIEANMAVLTRQTGLSPYGLKLAQVKAYIRIKHIGEGDHMQCQYMLCTNVTDKKKILPILVKEDFPDGFVPKKIKKVKFSAKKRKSSKKSKK